MNSHTIYARFGLGCRLLAGVTAVSYALPSMGQNGIPVFETKYELHYQFPEEGSEVLPGAFRTSIVGSEKITRDKRETIMRYDGALGFSLAARPLNSSDSLPAGTIDLYVRLTDVDMICRAGRGSYSIHVNSEGLHESRPVTGEVTLGPHDQYVGSHTVSSLLAKPGTLRFANGALLEAPTVLPMLTSLDCGWMYAGITSVLPPLPSKAIGTGQTWKAGMPVRLSVFGQPQIIRFDLRFEEYDESTHVARVSWKSTLASTSVLPVPGIHHIGPDAVASGTISGEMRMHVDTGVVLDSVMRIDVGIRHVKSSSTMVRYNKVYTLKNLDLSESGARSIATAGEEQGENEP